MVSGRARGRDTAARRQLGRRDKQRLLVRAGPGRVRSRHVPSHVPRNHDRVPVTPPPRPCSTRPALVLSESPPPLPPATHELRVWRALYIRYREAPRLARAWRRDLARFSARRRRLRARLALPGGVRSCGASTGWWSGGGAATEGWGGGRGGRERGREEVGREWGEGREGGSGGRAGRGCRQPLPSAGRRAGPQTVWAGLRLAGPAAPPASLRSAAGQYTDPAARSRCPVRRLPAPLHISPLPSPPPAPLPSLSQTRPSAARHPARRGCRSGRPGQLVAGAGPAPAAARPCRARARPPPASGCRPATP